MGRRQSDGNRGSARSAASSDHAAATASKRAKRKAPAESESPPEAPAATGHLKREIAELKRELEAAHRHQAATVDVLKVISRSTFDLQKVLDTLVESAAVLCGADLAVMRRRTGTGYPVAATHGFRPEWREQIERYSPTPGPGSIFGRAALEDRTVHIPDILVDPHFERPEMQQMTGFRAALGVPLRRDGSQIGILVLQRFAPGPFTPKQIELVETFADQAVIAIENTRLFNETREALQRQTAMSDILRIISTSPTSLQPVLDAIAENAARLCSTDDAVIWQRDGEALRLAATWGPHVVRQRDLPISHQSVVGRAVHDRTPVHVEDLPAVFATEFPEARGLMAGGYRTVLAVPLLSKGEAIGAIGLRRTEVRLFSDSQIALLRTFADQAVIAIENTRLFSELEARTHELSEALDYQTAISGVLDVISRSPNELQPVFDAIARSGKRLFDAHMCNVFQFDGTLLNLKASEGLSAEAIGIARTHYPAPPGRASAAARAILTGDVAEVPDVQDDAEYAVFTVAAIDHYRSVVAVPMLKDGRPVGAIAVARAPAGRFPQRQIDLLKTFADQAVIAIENARLFEEVEARTREVTEALEYQTATSEVLNVISRSPTDTQPVFDAIAQSTARLCQAEFCHVYRFDGERIHFMASHGQSPEGSEAIRRAYPMAPGRGSCAARAIMSGTVEQIPDVRLDPDYTHGNVAEVMNIRSIVAVPMIKDGRTIGAIALVRTATGYFPQRQIELLQTFADQAVIAITNVSLFEEVQDRTRDLTEALEQQTATSEVLKVISRSPFDLEPVLQNLLNTAAQLADVQSASLTTVADGEITVRATYGMPAAYFEAMVRHIPASGRGSVVGRALTDGRTHHVADVLSDPEFTLVDDAERYGFRTVLAVPLVREGQSLGAIALVRHVVHPFSQREVELVETFADQAVIAIENVRLFEEIQARTRDLTEALEYQTATGEVLNVISRSPTDTQPVFDAIAQSTARLCQAEICHVYRFDGELIHYMASHGQTPEVVEALRRAYPMAPGRGSCAARAIMSGAVEQIPDVQLDPDYTQGSVAEVMKVRSLVAVPMLKDGRTIGGIALARDAPGHFPQRQIELLQTFADQAVIAITNVSLFEEVQDRTRELTEALEQQTATSEVLKVISRSPFDLEPVLQSLLDTAAQLAGAPMASLTTLAGDEITIRAVRGISPELFETIAQRIPSSGHGSEIGRALADGRTHHLPNVLSDRDYALMDTAVRFGFRTVLGVPLLREGQAIGVISLMRTHIQPFSQREIELVETFADQAVIAIENVRLFDEIQARTREVTEALEQQTATSEVLKLISRSPFDLEPVLRSLLDTAAQLADAPIASITTLADGDIRVRAVHGVPIDFYEAVAQLIPSSGRGSAIGRALEDGRTHHVPDVLADPEYTLLDTAKQFGFRTVLAVPLVRDGRSLGAIALMRDSVHPFSQREIEVVETFADQAVIAIENVRLFDEIQARTRELTESLEQQIATSEILSVISSSLTDTQPVFDAIVRSGQKLFPNSLVTIAVPEGEQVKAVAVAEADTVRAEAWRRRFPFPLTREYMHSAAILDRQVVDIPDVRDAPAVFAAGSRNFLESQHRAVTIVPMMRGDAAIGTLSVVRLAPGPLSEKQRTVLQTFADQAVIAINNVALFQEVQARTRDLTESLRQQTATADVLKVISRSTFDLQTVLRALLESAVKLCECDQATITRQRDGRFYRAEAYGFSPEFLAAVREIPVEPERSSAHGRALLEGHAVHIPDVQADSEYTFQAQVLGGYRTVLAVPMMKEGVAIGVISFTRLEPRPFTDKQIELASTFADQAAIAIENVRLFDSVEARTRELTQSLEDLRAAQNRLIQTEKLASLGQLTAGIAHEIKNPLNFVNNFAAISADLIGELREALHDTRLDAATRAGVAELTDMLRGNLDKVVQHGKRADSIVKNMLLHSREGSGEHRPVNINAIVEESLNLAYHGARAERPGFNITMEKSLDPAAGEIDLFPQEIMRVLLNLISNGFYAATRRKAETSGTREPTLAAITRNLGDRVEIRVRDNGTGIPPDVKDKIFNPFFTTKPAGEGTGLGLSLSYDIIVKQHAGTIEVDTQPGEFTEFRIILPRAAASIAKSGERT